MLNGINSKTTAGIADAIATSLNGQELTRIQTDRLRSAMDSAVVRDVMSDITKKKADGIDSIRNNGYDKTNTPGDDAVTQGTVLCVKMIGYVTQGTVLCVKMIGYTSR